MTADRTIERMGTEVRIVASPQAADDVEALLRDYDRRLSRFRPDSELTMLNSDPRETVPASPLMREAILVAIEAAEQTGGLVDPTLLPELEAAGYVSSWDPARRVPLAEALAGLPSASPASAHPAARWREIRVDDHEGTISRPPGIRLDTGGTGKGHAVDLAAEVLQHEPAWAVSCGGDLRVGGSERRPRAVRIADPFDRGTLATLHVRHGAFATSGISARVWRNDDGRIAHHILDPATGEPAFSGLVTVTALAPTAARAEALAKAALLGGAQAARRILTGHGGLTVDAQGQVERVGALKPRPVVRMRRAAARPPASRARR